MRAKARTTTHCCQVVGRCRSDPDHPYQGDARWANRAFNHRRVSGVLSLLEWPAAR